MRKGLAYDPFAEIVSPVQELPKEQIIEPKEQPEVIPAAPKKRTKPAKSSQPKASVEPPVAVIEEPVERVKADKERLERLTVNVRSSVANSARDACWWCRISLTEFVQTAIEHEVARLQKERNSGEAFETRGGELKPGRPLGS